MTPARLALRADGLVRFGAAAACLGGVLRIASSLITLDQAAAATEVLYGVIDLCLLYGLIAVYVAHADVLGLSGLSGFLLGAAGVASIVGPEGSAFGEEIYRYGALALLTGLAVVAIQLMRAGVMKPSAGLWMAAFLVGLMAPASPAAFMAAGLCLGGGYALAGLSLLLGSPGVRPARQG